MKNIKNTIAAMSLMAVLGLGAISANAGILVSDNNRTVTSNDSCAKSTSVLDQLKGILIVGFSSSFTGILLGDVAAPCTQSTDTARDGILIVG